MNVGGGKAVAPAAASAGAIAALLLAAERRIALLDACMPVNAQAERERVLAGWRAGHPCVPRWLLPQRADLTPLRRELGALAESTPGDALGDLYVARARELELEAALVEARGTPHFALLCARRYPLAAVDVQAELDRSRLWLEETAAVAGAPLGSMASSSTLVRALGDRARRLGLSPRIEVRRELAAVAAVGEGVVFVKEGASLVPTAQVPRIVCHEIEGHLAPRAVALREPCWLFRVGSAGAGEDEEGRALLLEERGGFLDPATPAGASRRRELALRHQVAHATRAGASFVDLMRLSLGFGESLERSYRLCERALRGGGLGRELTYLPAYGRVRRALAERPSLEAWMRRGRISIAAARVFEGVFEGQE